MEASGNTQVFWILGVVFVALGVYLYLFTRKRGRLMTDFAMMRGLSHIPKDNGILEQQLENVLDYRVTGVVRTFSKIRDVLEGGGITMFRGTELLDLSRHGKSQNTHFGRIAAYFDISVDTEVYVTFTPEGGFANQHPAGGDPEGAPGFPRLKTIVGESRIPYPLSATLRAGKAVLYFEPGFGSEKLEDLQMLYEIAHELKENLS